MFAIVHWFVLTMITGLKTTTTTTTAAAAAATTTAKQTNKQPN